jgi:hypothetical protein
VVPNGHAQMNGHINGYTIKSRWTVWHAEEIVPEAADVCDLQRM